MNSNLVKDIGNSLFDATLVAVAAVGSRYLSKSMGFKDRPIEFKPKSVAMLAVDIGFGTFLVKKLRDSKALPDKIFT